MKVQILQRPETDPLRPDRHRVLVFHAVEIHPDDRRIRLVGQPHALRPQLPRQALRMLLDRLRLGKQRLPPGQDLLDPLGNAEPQLPGHVPVGAEVQPRLLPYPAVDADITHQAVGLARLSGLVGVGLGRLDEQCRLRCRPRGRIAGRGDGGNGWLEPHGPTEAISRNRSYLEQLMSYQIVKIAISPHSVPS